MKILSFLLSLLCIGCASMGSKHHSSDSKHSGQNIIGYARMNNERSIFVYINTSVGDMHGTFATWYHPDDEHYDSVLNHIGGLNPGEEKPVPIWPDE